MIVACCPFAECWRMRPISSGKGQSRLMTPPEVSAFNHALSVAVDVYAGRAIYHMTSCEHLATLYAVHRAGQSRVAMGHAKELGIFGYCDLQTRLTACRLGQVGPTHDICCYGIERYLGYFKVMRCGYSTRIYKMCLQAPACCRSITILSLSSQAAPHQTTV